MKHLFCILAVAAANTLAFGQSEWSGTAEFTVEAEDVKAGDWDYIPQSVQYETDGVHWRILEQGTSFERIWMGRHGADRYHILFHFLGNAVELEERCAPEVAEALPWGMPPCPWAEGASAGQVAVTDGPVQYTLVLVASRTAHPNSWSRKHFDLPHGYEPIDKIGLAALLQRLNRSSE